MGAGKELAMAFVTGKLGDDMLEGSLDGHNQLGDLLTEEQGCHFLGELLVDNPTLKGKAGASGEPFTHRTSGPIEAPSGEADLPPRSQ